MYNQDDKTKFRSLDVGLSLNWRSLTFYDHWYAIQRCWEHVWDLSVQIQATVRLSAILYEMYTILFIQNAI